LYEQEGKLKKSVKKKIGRPPGRKAARRPVLATRVPEDFYETIRQAAQLSGRTLSEELIWRARQSFEWERQFGEGRKILDDACRVSEGILRQFMTDKGWTRISSSAGPLWAEPGVPAVPLGGHLHPEVEAAITKAVQQAFAEAKKKSQS
jgi:hypothetical protein